MDLLNRTYKIHSIFFLYILCSCLPINDEICKRTANFINHFELDCALVSRLTRGIYFERMQSTVSTHA